MDKAYLKGARAALDLADKCRASADDYDDQWRSFMLAEEKRHRARAKAYLRLMGRTPRPASEEAA